MGVTDFGIAAATGWTALRAAVIAPAAVGAGLAVAGELTRGPFRRLLWALVLATILAPDLVAGYGYSNFSLSLIRHPAWNEAFLTLLIGLKATAVAAVILYFSPEPSLTPAGRHMVRLAGRRIGLADRSRILVRGGFGRALPALAVAFLFAFQQFELPSLTGGTAWTVTVFDRQALVPDLSESADPLLLPLAVELIVIGPIVALVLRSAASNRRAVAPARRALIASLLGWLVALAAAALTAALPFAMLLREGTEGLFFVVERTPNAAAYWREIVVATSYGVTAGLAAYLVASGLLRLISSRRWRTVGVILLPLACVSGLCGPLVPSLFAVELFQRPWLLPLRDTLLPLMVVLTLYLLPRAVLLEALARLVRGLPAIHVAKALTSSDARAQRSAGHRLLWDLDGFGRFCRVSLLAYWGYLDLTAATILAPPAVIPVTARLYNLMHYGHNAALSAMTLVAVAVPVAAFAAAIAARHLSLRLISR